jgi:arabinose-5-phosphate isomerase
VTDPRRLAERVLRLEAAGILGLVDKLDASFVRAIDLLRDCQGRVIVSGIGKSGLIGRKIAATLASTGTPASFLHPAEAAHGDLGMVTRGDVVLAMSNSGETAELLGIVEPLKRLGAPIILMTAQPGSVLARLADVVLDVGVAEEACPLNLAPTASTTAVLAMGDALAMVLMELRGLRADDYAALHPRGALGWRALFRVSNLMHRGEAVPIVHEDAAMKDVVIEMTAKRLGVTTVVDSRGELAGVVTDGDVRRLYLRDGSLLGLRARDCMTTTPKVVAADELAARALEIMEAFAITSLIIVDGERRPVGVIHMHDILRAKIV